MAGLLDYLGMQNTLGSAGLLGAIQNAYGGPDRMQGLLLTLGGHEAPGMMLMNQANQRDASAEFNRQIPGLFQQQSMPQPMPQPASQPRTMSADATVPIGTTGAPTPNFGNAIASIESGGKYDALGPVTKTGDRAYGKYQVMGNNIGPWTQQHLGRQLTPEQFLADPQAQDAVFNAQFGQYASKYGPTGAAKAWFAGEKGMNNPEARDQLGTSVSSYAQKFDNAMGGGQTLVGQSPGSPQGGVRLEQPQQAQAPQQQPGGMSPRITGLIKMLSIPNLPEGQRKVAETLLQNELANAKNTDDMREFQFAKQDGFTGNFEQWMARKRANSGKYGLNPIWGTGPDGKPTVLQLSNEGTATATKLPDGVTVGKDVIKLDAGTHWILLDPVTRQQIGQVSKNIEQKEIAEKVGQATGDARVNLNNTLATADQALQTIDQIRKHPGKQSMFATGSMGWVPGIPGTDQAGFVSLVEQAKGQTFLTAYNTLKGGGAITEVEGRKAEQAIARLQRTQNIRDFDQALSDLESVIRAGQVRARQRAGAPSQESPRQEDPLGIR